MKVETVLRIAAEAESVPRRDESAPADLKARLYSALVRHQAESGALRPLSETRRAGGRLCVFEKAVALVPISGVDSANPCRACHARVLAEGLAHAPIYWPGCPYVRFQRD